MLIIYPTRRIVEQFIKDTRGGPGSPALPELDLRKFDPAIVGLSFKRRIDVDRFG
jgi:hypothetical protein